MDLNTSIKFYGSFTTGNAGTINPPILDANHSSGHTTNSERMTGMTLGAPVNFMEKTQELILAIDKIVTESSQQTNAEFE